MPSGGYPWVERKMETRGRDEMEEILRRLYLINLEPFTAYKEKISAASKSAFIVANSQSIIPLHSYRGVRSVISFRWNYSAPSIIQHFQQSSKAYGVRQIWRQVFWFGWDSFA